MLVLSVAAWADSSWLWISKTRPYDVLPWVAILTIAIESISINIIPKILKSFKVFCVVTLANLLSFAAPYLLNFLMYKNYCFEFDKYLEHWPAYTVGGIYGFVTVAIELPVVYSVLKNDTDSKKKLLWVIICANIVTTVLVALAERIFCQGRW